MTPTVTTSIAIADVEKWGRLSMPSSAQDIRAYVNTSGPDALVVLTFKLPRADLDSFVSDAGYSGQLQPVGDGLPAVAHFIGFSDRLPAWPSDAEWEGLVGDATRVLRGQQVDEPGFHRSLLVDETDPYLVTIYLVHFEVY